MLTWERQPDGRSLSIVEGLGTVEIYLDRGGYAIDINKRRAWSACRGSEDAQKRFISSQHRSWAYLNSFKPIIPPAPKP